MAAKTKTAAPAPTNFDIWKETLTPEFIASGKFIVLSCGACPASGVTCNKYDTTPGSPQTLAFAGWSCRGNFLLWARAKAGVKNEEATE
jgi:hypothetical protein